MPPKKVENTDKSDKESFQKFLISLEEEPDANTEEEEEEEEDNLFLGQDSNDDYEDEDDNDSLNEWMREEEDFIEDSEITQLLNASIEKRTKLKTGGFDEMELDIEEFENNLTLTSGIGKMKKGVKRKLTSGEIRLPEEIKRKLGEANALYIAKDYGNAISILQQVITDHPQAHPAWNTLGLIHDELGNKSKSLRLRMVAAHLCHDPNLWKELAQKSIENNAPKQAIHCLTKAINIEPTDVDALWDRSFLYKQAGKNLEAIDGFNLILEIMPHHFKVLNELAQLYRSEGRTVDAIKMYEEAIVYHTENPEQVDDDDDDEEEFTDKLGYSEINMLSELYLIMNDYERCLDTIKTGLRLVQQRQDEIWWIDHIDDDDEFFEDDETKSEFPIELRVRMGVCRVYLRHVEIATKHFNYLLQYPPTTYPDLHQDVAYAYYDKRHYELALKVFQKIIDSSDEIEIDLLIRTADCYRETGDLETSVVFYVNVLEEQPENLDVMVSLATVYEDQGKEEQALDLIEFVMKKNRETRKINKAIAKNNVDVDTETENNAKNKKISIFDEEQKTKKDELNRTKAQKAKEQQEKELNTKSLFDKLDDIDKKSGPEVVNMDRGLLRDYMRTAGELWTIFHGTRAFYPNSRSVRYDGFYKARQGKNRQEKIVSDLEAQFLANRLRQRVKRDDSSNIDIEELDEEEKQELESTLNELKLSYASQYLDVSLDKWCQVFMKYAYMLAITKRPEDAYDLLKNACDANVFFHNFNLKLNLKYTLLGCGLITENQAMTQEAARSICLENNYISDTFRIYTLALTSGKHDPAGMISYAQIKFVSRVVRLMDALVSNSTEGSEKDMIALDEIKELDDAILAMNVKPSTIKEQGYKRFYETPNLNDTGKMVNGMQRGSLKNTDPVLLTLFGHLLNISRNHIGSTLYYMRSYALEPKDPANTLCLALSFLQASSQRRCDNRHMLIMQGMLFLLEYIKLRGKCQETEYNLAYCFHSLGLTHLAIPHYEKVLCMPSIAKADIEEEKPIEDVYKWPVDYMEEDQDDIEYDDTDLKREAAYNLHLIYVTSGSLSLAEIVLIKYCTV